MTLHRPYSGKLAVLHISVIFRLLTFSPAHNKFLTNISVSGPSKSIGPQEPVETVRACMSSICIYLNTSFNEFDDFIVCAAILTCNSFYCAVGL
jgi:hypothetical protein